MGQKNACPRSHTEIIGHAAAPHTNRMDVTLDTSHAEMGWLNALAPWNIALRERGRARGRDEEAPLGGSGRASSHTETIGHAAAPHTSLMSVTLDTSHAEMGWLNVEAYK